ncbi:MAG TPA: nucleotidyltransferase domain-containing protein [Fimbriimonadaceae bacterium]|nr:nucleotidyltransferase domain-containing protein [Fimbriimonadaceae bacterium]
MRELIESALAQIEAEHQVRILYACESGSRAWGFASADSDYDVRFIYVHSRDWYLSILDHRDVIEKMLPGDLDVSGWEIRKALKLFRKSNPPLLEWLSSPIVYREDSVFTARLRELMATYYSPGSCFRHYLHMAEGNVRGYLQGDVVRTKKYLYVLRPLLGCRWIEQERGPVPMEFEKLFATVEDRVVLRAIEDLVEKKKSGTELEGGYRNEVLSGFIEAELPRLTALPYVREAMRPVDELDRLFRDVVKAT